MISDKFKYAKHGTLGVQGRKSRTTERIAVGFLMAAAILAAAALWYTSWPKEAKGEINICDTMVCPPEKQAMTIPMIGSWYDYDLPGAKGYSTTHATAASRDFPRKTNLLVCRTDDQNICIIVRVNDFGPDASVHPDRGLDLSSYAFQQLAPLESGLVDVSVRAVK